MTQMRGWPVVVLLAGLACFVVACGIFILVAESHQAIAVAAAILTLALTQFIVALVGWRRNASTQRTLQAMAREKHATDDRFKHAFVEASLFDQEIAALTLRATQSGQEIHHSIAANRAELLDMMQRLGRSAVNPGRELWTGTQTGPQTDHRHGSGKKPSPPMAEQLSFLLEPIIDLSSNQTAHYRARFAMANGAGGEIAYATLVANADHGGLRPSLDRLVVSQAIPLLRRLRLKHPAMKLLLPLGVATLQHAATLGTLDQTLAEAADVAEGIVFELTHEDLGELDEAGIAGLAALARMGTNMAIVGAKVAGIDLAALRQLGVLFVGIDARSVESGFGIEPSWQSFLQVARAKQVHILLTDVTTSSQAAASGQVARFVAGPFFAPPRRVKSNAGVTGPIDMSAAA